jgi:hypothetical protein
MPITDSSTQRRHDIGFPTFPTFPPLIRRPWTGGRQAARVGPAAGTGCAAPVEESMLMNFMPISLDQGRQA